MVNVGIFCNTNAGNNCHHFFDAKRYRVIHFGLTVFYSIMNLLHVILDLFVQPILWYQITLMVFLFLLGLLLNIVAFQWMKLPPYKGNKRQEILANSHS